MDNGKLGPKSSKGGYHFDTSAAELVVLSPFDDTKSQVVTDMIRANLSGFQEAGTVLASTWRRLRDIEKTYSREGTRYLVAEFKNTGEIVGGVGILPFAGLSFNERKGTICDLFVNPAFRGQNIGKKLFNEVIYVGKQFGYASMYLETTPEMLHAQKLFRRFGFRPISDREDDKTKTSDELACYFILENL
ncbi:GNAT family N-acetyltransferase [Oligoflexaceae bacterium]|nr:GNAT family N-acetyltransferase [Oligoflexaceae bacterium]